MQLHDALFSIAESPVVAASGALAEREGTQAAFDALAPDDPRLADYQPYWAARANLVSRAGARAKALGGYALAIGLERDPAVRRFL